MKNLNKSLLLIGLVGSMAVCANAFAQDCATPLPIQSDSQVSGDTCTAGNPLPTYGGTGSPQNEVIYSFVAQGANATINIAATGGFSGGASPGFFLFPACSASTDPVAFGATGVDMTVSGLTDGQTYYIAATSDPGGPNNGCGAYDLTVTGTLPVTQVGS